MIRTFNYTGRQKIKLSQISIDIIDTDEDIKSFKADLSLDGLNLPMEAKVYIEPYYKSSSMRFDFGSVGEILPPDDLRLTEIETGGSILFRVKVVDESNELGKIIAVADRIRPVQDKLVVSNHRPLLPVEHTNLGESIWRLQFDAGGCVLLVNNRIPGIKDILSNDPTFFSLVYPAILREVLQRIIIIEKHIEITEDDDDWRNLWLQFALSLGIESPDFSDEGDEVDIQEESDWIEDVVNKFNQTNSIYNRYVEAKAMEEQNG